MKKSLLLTLGIGALSTLSLTATTYDLYITGSTAFRANVYTACTKLYDSAPAIVYGTSATGGNSPQGTVSKNTQWTMSGTVNATCPNIGSGNTLNIHAYFTGSVQGVQTVEQQQAIIFVNTAGNAITNTPTIAFSDVDTASTPYATPGVNNDDAELKLCVQPFVMCKAVGTPSTVTNVTWDVMRSIIQPGRLPLSAWTHNTNDHSSYVYLVQRTKDSGTRRTELAEVQFQYNQTATEYIFDNVTNQTFYFPSSQVVIGAPGNNGANLNWGSGYVAGSDVATELGYNYPGNSAIAILSVSDAKGVTGVNWSQVLPFNATWPTAAAAGIAGNSGTNDYSPISLGQYPLWAYEKCVYPTDDPSSHASGDQNLSQNQLGDTSTVGSILYVLCNVSYSGSPMVGSIDNEIELSKTGGATAIRLKDMTASRSSVGGSITP